MVVAEGHPAFLKEPKSESIVSFLARLSTLPRTDCTNAKNAITKWAARVCDIWGAFPYRIFFGFISDFQKSSVSVRRMLGGVKCSGNWKIMNALIK